MEKLGLNEIRKKYLDFFEEKGHLKMNSFSLIPENDNSLLLINSGMAPLKSFFIGQQIPPRKRVTTCQKCIRTGDIENVGKTARHGTFFEMLGNFSFGDYFKNEAISWAWEFCTNVLNLSKERLYVSIYNEDNETFKIWNEKMNIPKDKIVLLGKKDNFWEHGTGPCGPCTEIYYDKGEQYGCKQENCAVGCDCDRYMEIWNLVFTQFNREEDGTYSNLKNPNIDTGMGLERITTVMQGVNSIFEIDTIKKIRDNICNLANTVYGKDAKKDISIRIITDHIRSVTFMTADGVLPSNEGRGYVLRRLLRRAVRHGQILGIKNLFLANLSKVVADVSKDAYPELIEKQDYIYKILTVEEERFNDTIEQGLELLKIKINEIKKINGKKVLNGLDCFKLYDTYGFPIDLMKEILEEEDIAVDEEQFLKEMDKQKNRARNLREESNYMGAKATIFNKLAPNMSSEFCGYDNLLFKQSTVLAIIANEDIKETLKENCEVAVILDKTPFYAEMGGQTGDKGLIINENLVIEVNDCVNFGGNKIIHKGFLKKGEIKVGQKVDVIVNEDSRVSTARNHTATHILHKVLKDVLGGHIEQAGSLVSESKLRFDFTHFEPISNEVLLKIEQLVNKYILSNFDVDIKEMKIEDAKKIGATALFGEKYGDVVRVVNIGDYSIELCGGTHLKNSSQIGSFKIISENGVSAGVRRIEAVTGFYALDYYNKQSDILNQVKSILKANSSNILLKVNSTIEDNKKLLRQIESLKSKLSTSLIDEFLNQKEIFSNISVIIKKVESMDMNSLRLLVDKTKEKLTDYVIILVNEYNDKVNIVSACSESAIKKALKAGDIVKIAANVCGGGGGGRSDMAQAGGKDVLKIEQALNETLNYVKSVLN